MIATTVPSNIQVENIPTLSKDEARLLAETELARCLEQLEELTSDDWYQATDCDEWTVHDMTAHLAGACAGHASWGEFRRQYVTNPYMKRSEAQIHGINRRQVAERADQTPAQLIAELREVGPRAIKTRQRIPGFIRAIRAPLPPLGVVSLRYLLDTIYTRDQWMHRADICRASGKPMHLTEDHDGRIVDLVMADVAAKLKDLLKGSLDITLTGAIERTYHFSSASQPTAHITIDILDFNRRASSRISTEAALELSLMSGDHDLAVWFWENCEVGY